MRAVRSVGSSADNSSSPAKSPSVQTTTEFLQFSVAALASPIAQQFGGSPTAVVPPSALKRLRIAAGDFVLVHSPATPALAAVAVVRAAVASAAADTVELDVQTRENAALALGASALLRPLPAPVVRARRCVAAAPAALTAAVSAAALRAAIVGWPLLSGACVRPSLAGRPLRVTIVECVPRPPAIEADAPVVYCVAADSHVQLIAESPMPAATAERSTEAPAVAGVDAVVGALAAVVAAALRQSAEFAAVGLQPPRGVLLFGPPGTGKTSIARAVAARSGARVFAISAPEVVAKYFGQPEAKLREVFAAAVSSEPALVFIDELDAICGRRDTADSESERRLTAAVGAALDGLRGRAVAVVAATNRPDAIDPALRRPGRFDREVAVGVPTEADRRAIIAVHLQRVRHCVEPERLSAVAAAAHGFVGADLAALVRAAAARALQRSTDDDNSSHAAAVCVSGNDLHAALGDVRPSGLREWAVEVPRVDWEAIGGQSDVKQRLREAVEWPLKYPEAFERMGIRAPRGVLLYGPPGCSKTLLAKALASQSGLNFLAVRGPELFSKWVGESERAVREVFRRARAAAPAIIFFDEIDALAVERGESSGGGAGDRVLSQLLSEMDGVQPLSRVTVIAATNRPDVLDKALLRPGRFDRLLYVGLPERAAREHIVGRYLRAVPHEAEVTAEWVAAQTNGYTGAEMVAVCREAALCAVEEERQAQAVAARHFETALERVRPRTSQAALDFYAAFSRSLLSSAGD